MKSKPDAKASKPLTETKIWLTALLVITTMVFVGLFFDACRGWDLYPMALRRAGAAFGVMLGWGGYHFYSRRDIDVNPLPFVAMVIVSVKAHDSISAAFIMSLGTAALALPIAGFVSRRAEPRYAKSAQKSQSDHPMYDADIDGAVGRLAFKPRRD